MRPGCAEGVDAEFGDVDGQLADGLACVEQNERAVGPREFDDLADGVDQAAVGGDVDDGDDANTIVEHVLECVEVDASVLIARDDLDVGTGRTRPPQCSDGVARVFDSADEDSITGSERNGSEEVVPRTGRAVRQSDIGCLSTDDPGQRMGNSSEGAALTSSCDVSADVGFTSQVLDHRGQHRLGRERGSRAVEEHLVEASGSVAADRVEIEHGTFRSCRCGSNYL